MIDIQQEMLVALGGLGVALLVAVRLWVVEWVKQHTQQVEADIKAEQREVETRHQMALASIKAIENQTDISKKMFETLTEMVSQNGSLIRAIETNATAVGQNTESARETVKVVGELAEATRKLHSDVRGVLDIVPTLRTAIEGSLTKMEEALKRWLEAHPVKESET